LSDNKAPAILVEMGYITNQNDVNFVSDPHKQHIIAEKIIDAVIAYGNSK
jgi:N-acetylmuramoyl-L-alanine amidase